MCFFRLSATFQFFQLFYVWSGADLGFSRGKDFLKIKFPKFLSIFLGRPNWLFELSQSTKKCLKFSALQAKLWKTGQKRRFSALFGNLWPKNCVFSARATPSKLVYIGSKAFRKVIGSVNKNGSLKIVQSGTLWVVRGSNSWEGGACDYGWSWTRDVTK